MNSLLQSGFLQTKGGQQTNHSGWVWHDFDGQKSRMDILSGIVFETLMRFDMNESFNIAEGHCYSHILFNPMQPFWFWLDQSFQGHECHADFVLKSGMTWNWIDPQNEYYTVCVAHDNQTPYWFERTEGNRSVFLRTIFTEWNATAPEPDVFDIPHSCSSTWVN